MDMVQNFRPADGQNRQVALRQLAVFCVYRLMDLRDLVEKRPPVDKSGLKSRVRMVVAQQKSKSVANNLVASLLKTCKHIQKNKGAVARG